MAAELREALDRRLRDMDIATVTAEHPQVGQPPENPGINPCLASGAQRDQGGMRSCSWGFSRSIDVEVLARPGRIFEGIFGSFDSASASRSTPFPPAIREATHSLLFL